MAVPKKKTSKTRTNRRHSTWVSKERKRLTKNLVLVPYGNGSELKPAHVYLDDNVDLRRAKKTAKKEPTTTDTTEKKPATKKVSKKKPAEDTKQAE